MADDDEPLTAREISDLSGIPLTTLHRRIRGGHIVPIRKLAGRTGPYLFDRSVLAELDLDDPKPAA